MIRRTPARFLAPLALIAFVVVAVMLVKGTNRDSKAQHPVLQHVSHRHVPKLYTIRSGDTLPAIAHHYGVPLARILALNPKVDPRALSVGSQLRLR